MLSGIPSGSYFYGQWSWRTSAKKSRVVWPVIHSEGLGGICVTIIMICAVQPPLPFPLSPPLLWLNPIHSFSLQCSFHRCIGRRSERDGGANERRMQTSEEMPQRFRGFHLWNASWRSSYWRALIDSWCLSAVMMFVIELQISIGQFSLSGGGMIKTLTPFSTPVSRCCFSLLATRGERGK